MKKVNQETVSACYKSLKAIQKTLVDVMIDEDREFEKLPESDQAGEPGETIGFEVDALDNVDYLLDEVITFIEENLGACIGEPSGS